MDAKFWLSILIPLAVAVIASAPGIYSNYRQTQAEKRQAERDKHRQPIEDLSAGVEVSSSAAKAIESYSREVIALRDELGKVRSELETIRQERIVDKALIEEWRVGISRLMAQFVSLNITPVWTPADRGTGPLRSVRRE